MAKKRPIFFGGVKYDSIVECAERTGIARERLRHALRYSKRIVMAAGEVHVDYADKVPISIKKSAPKPIARRSGALIPRLCTHRLGAYLGGWW